MFFDILQWFGRLFNRPESGKLPPIVEREVTPKIKLNMSEPWTHAKRKKAIEAIAALNANKKKDAD